MMTPVAKFFNTAGPVQFDFHYKIDPLTRFDLEEVLQLIQQNKYFVLHAPRQTGKTSALFALRDYLNAQGDCYALYINVEAGQSKRGKEVEVVKGILSAIDREMTLLFKWPWMSELYQEFLKMGDFSEAITKMLSIICARLDKPFVLFIDEIDALVGDSLISVLRQIRAGYGSRPAGFPKSIILCGVRDIRDYRIHTSGQEIITGGSAFNIKAESLRLGNFSREEIRQLYELHTKETGQIFEEECYDLAWRYTEGQPWLVNALAYEVTYKMKENRDRTIPITAEMYMKAKENLVQRRETHIDALLDKLKEERIANIIAPILSGDYPENFISNNDDVEYAIDLGLIVKDKPLRIANEIYKEVIPRELTWAKQQFLHEQPIWYLNDDNSINMHKLMEDFQQFYRNNADWWSPEFRYIESGPQLLMQAYLQRIINGGGYIHREYAMGSGRTDLLIMKQLSEGYGGPWQRVVIEMKIHRKESLETLIQKGLEQTYQYMDTMGNVSEGHLLIFEKKEKSWEEKIWYRQEYYNGRLIHVWGA